HSGWPFPRETLAAYYPRAQALVEAGPWFYDKAAAHMASQGAPLALGEGGVYTSWFQFSKTRDSELPTYFGHRYEEELKRAPHLTVLLNANVTGIRLAPDGARVDHLDGATLTGKGFTVKPHVTVLA